MVRIKYLKQGMCQIIRERFQSIKNVIVPVAVSILIIATVNLPDVVVSAVSPNIDIGSYSSTRNSSFEHTGCTIIDLYNPANATGYITSFYLYPSVNMSGVYLCTFYCQDGCYYLRDYVSCPGNYGVGNYFIGNVVLSVTIGDYLGIYYTGGAIMYSDSGGLGVAYKSGMPGTVNGSGWNVVSGDISLQGYGIQSISTTITTTVTNTNTDTQTVTATQTVTDTITETATETETVTSTLSTVTETVTSTIQTATVTETVITTLDTATVTETVTTASQTITETETTTIAELTETTTRTVIGEVDTGAMIDSWLLIAYIAVLCVTMKLTVLYRTIPVRLIVIAMAIGLIFMQSLQYLQIGAALIVAWQIYELLKDVDK
jgi:hypothetical protein